MAENESVIRIRADASQAVSELTKLRNSITLSYNSLDKAAESFKELKDRQRALKDITKITTKFIDRLGKELKKAGANSSKAKKEFKQLNMAMKGTSQAFASAGMRARAFGRDMKGVGLAIRNSGKNLQFMGRSIMIGMLPFANAIRKASNFARALEMAEIRFIKITGLMRDSTEFQDLATDLEKVSHQFAVSLDMVTDIATDFALVGMPLDDIDTLVRAANELAVLGQIDVGPAKDILISTTFALRNMAALSGDTLSFADAIKQATSQLYYFNLVNNNTAMQISDMADGLPKLIPITTQFGMTITETAGMLAALKAGGVSAAEGTVALRTGLLRLTSLTKQAQDAVADATTNIEGFNFEAGVGIETLASFADGMLAVQKAGSDEDAFSLIKKIMGIRQTAKFKLFTSDLISAASEIESVTGVLQQLGASQGIEDVFGDTAIATLSDFTRASREPTEAMKAVATEMLKSDNRDLVEGITSQFLRSLVIQMSGVENAMDTSLEEMKRVMESDAFKMQQAKTDIKNATAEIGGLINMMIVDHILPHIRKLVAMFRAVPDPIKKVIVIIAALTAAFGPLLYMLAILKMAFGQVFQIMGGAVMKMVSRMTAAGRAAIAAANQEAVAIEMVTAAKTHEIAMTDLLITKEHALKLARMSGSTAARTEAAAAGLLINKQIASTDAALTAQMLRGGGGGAAKAGFMAALTGRAVKNAKGTFVDKDPRSAMQGKFMKGSMMANMGASLRGNLPVQQMQDRFAKLKKTSLARRRKMGRWMGAGPSGRQSGMSWLRGVGTPGLPGTQLPPIAGPHVGGAAGLIAPATGIGAMGPSARSQFATKVATKAKSGGKAAMAATMAPVESMRKVAKGAKTAGKAVKGKMGGAFKAILPFIKKFGGLLAKWGPMLLQPINLLKKVLFFLRKLNPWGLAITVLFGLFAAVFITIKNNFKSFMAAAKPGLDALSNAWKSLKKALGSVMDAIFQIFNRLSFGTKKGADEGTQMGKIFGAVFQAIAFMLNVVAVLFQGLAYAVSRAMSFISPALNIVLGVLTYFVNLIKMIIALVKGDFTGAWAYAKRAIGAILLTLVGFVGDVFKFLVDQVADSISLIGATIGWLGRLMPDDFGGSWLQSFADGVDDASDSVRNFGRTAMDPVTNAIRDSMGIGVDEMIRIQDEELRNIGSEAAQIVGSGAEDELDDLSLVGEGDEPGWHDATNALREHGEEAAAAYIDGFISAFMKFVQQVKRLLTTDLKEVLEQEVDLFNDATQVVVDGFNEQIETIQEVIKAEGRLSKEVAYQTKRREQVKNMALRRDSYRRNRALAIYEGRIDDARTLDLKEKSDKEKADAKLVGLDEKRGATILSQQRADEMDQINAARTAYEERRKIMVDELKGILDELAVLVPATAAEWDKLFVEIDAAVTKITGTGGGPGGQGGSGALERLRENFNPATLLQTAMDRAVEIMQNTYDWAPAVGPLDWLTDYFASDGLETRFQGYEATIKEYKDRLKDAYLDEQEPARIANEAMMGQKGLFFSDGSDGRPAGFYTPDAIPLPDRDYSPESLRAVGEFPGVPMFEQRASWPGQLPPVHPYADIAQNWEGWGYGGDAGASRFIPRVPGVGAGSAAPSWVTGGDDIFDPSGETGGTGNAPFEEELRNIHKEYANYGGANQHRNDVQGLRGSLGGVKSLLADGVVKMANEAATKGLVFTASGMRDMAKQEYYFNDRYKEGASGRTGSLGDRTWKGVTYHYVGGGASGEGEVAVPGSSMHGRGEAVDVSGPAGQKSRRHTFLNNWGNKAGIWSPLEDEPWHFTRYPKTNISSLFTGGMVGGAGSAGQMIMAHGQEFVMNAAATRRIGMGTLNNMNNYARFTGPTGAAGGTSNTSSSNVTIHVDTFVGERAWFEKMMADYNINVAPSSERTRGIEKRTVGSYTERNTRSRV